MHQLLQRPRRRDGLQVATRTWQTGHLGSLCKWLSSANRAEWAAARGQTDHVFSGSNNVSTVAWYSGNSNGQPQPSLRSDQSIRPVRYDWKCLGVVLGFYAPKAYHLPNRRDPVGDTGKTVMRGSAGSNQIAVWGIIRSRGKENGGSQPSVSRCAFTVTYRNK